MEGLQQFSPAKSGYGDRLCIKGARVCENNATMGGCSMGVRRERRIEEREESENGEEILRRRWDGRNQSLEWYLLLSRRPLWHWLYLSWPAAFPLLGHDARTCLFLLGFDVFCRLLWRTLDTLLRMQIGVILFTLSIVKA